MTGVRLAVAGAHLSGQPLHHQLADRGASFVATTTTSPDYRMFALATEPPKPGVVRVVEGGTTLEVEVWELDEAGFGSFVAALPSPMAIGQVTLVDGSTVSGFLVEPFALASARDISEYGGWRAYRASQLLDLQ